MRKRKPARLYPAKEDITIKNFLLEERQLLLLLILIVIITIFIIGCLFTIDGFRAEKTYNYISVVYGGFLI